MVVGEEEGKGGPGEEGGGEGDHVQHAPTRFGLTLDALESMSSCLALILCHAASCNHGKIEHTHPHGVWKYL